MGNGFKLLVRRLFKGLTMAKKTKRKLAQPRLPMQGQLNLEQEGQHFDLREIFDRLNARYFRGRLRGYKVVWGQRRRRRAKDFFVFGSIQEEDRVIRINPRLDQEWVPLWFLQYVLYHEMLHSVVPDEVGPGGRRRVHTEEFYRRERKFRGYHRARRWEDENLARFLR
ncbi:MAG: SprT-like domain-containing protein [Chthoniobacterales bacterium]